MEIIFNNSNEFDKFVCSYYCSNVYSIGLFPNDNKAIIKIKKSKYNFNIGDRVKFIDYNIFGIITQVNLQTNLVISVIPRYVSIPVPAVKIKWDNVLNDKIYITNSIEPTDNPTMFECINAMKDLLSKKQLEVISDCFLQNSILREELQKIINPKNKAGNF